MKRVWVDGEDWGTMHERAAVAVEQFNKEHYPNETVRLEDVPEDAPTFLEEE